MNTHEQSGKEAATTTTSQPTWPAEPTCKVVDGVDRSTVTDLKQLHGKVVEVVMVGGATFMPGSAANPLEAYPVRLHCERVVEGARGRIEGRLVLSPRTEYPHLTQAFNDAGVDWSFYGGKAFIRANELSGDFSIPTCKLVEPEDAKRWIEKSAKVQRARERLAKGTSGVFDKLTLPKVIAYAGATTAAAMVGYSVMHRDLPSGATRATIPPSKDPVPAQSLGSEASKQAASDKPQKITVSTPSTPTNSASTNDSQASSGPGTKFEIWSLKAFLEGMERESAYAKTGSTSAEISQREVLKKEGQTPPATPSSQSAQSKAVSEPSPEQRGISASGGGAPVSGSLASETQKEQLSKSAATNAVAPSSSTRENLLSPAAPTTGQSPLVGDAMAQRVTLRLVSQSGLDPVFSQILGVEREVSVLPPPGQANYGLPPQVQLRAYNIIMSDRSTQLFREVVVSRLPGNLNPDQYIQRLLQMMNSGTLPGVTLAYKRPEVAGDVVALNLDSRYNPNELLNWIASRTIF